MILEGSKIRIIDNSGVKLIRCIRILNKKGCYGRIGDIIKGSIIKSLGRSLLKKGKTCNVLLIQTKGNGRFRNKGYFVKWKDNVGVLIGNKNELLGTRINCFIPEEFRRSLFKEVCNIGNGCF